MKNRMLVALAVVGFVGLTIAVGSLLAAEKADLSKVTCPVSGKAVNPDATVDYKGGEVYFCCENCPKAFAKDTAKFATKANHQLIMTGQAAQAKCPISGKKTKDTSALDVAGVSVVFCCDSCKGKVDKAEGDAQLDLVFGDKAFGKAFVVATAVEK